MGLLDNYMTETAQPFPPNTLKGGITFAFPYRAEAETQEILV